MNPELFRLHADLEERHWWFTGRRRIVGNLARRLVLPSRRATVIDIGCGTGANIAALSEDYRCIGIDPGPEAIDFARRRFPRVEFICGYAPDDLGAEASTADLVLLTDVLEHVEHDDQLLRRILAPLTPGAQVIITVPADATLWSEHDVSFGHFRRYETADFAQLWAGLPIRTRLVSHFNTRLYPAVKAARTLARRRGHATGSMGTDFGMTVAPLNWALERIFAGEASRLIGSLDRDRPEAYRFGVSLIAVLRREPGSIG